MSQRSSRLVADRPTRGFGGENPVSISVRSQVSPQRWEQSMRGARSKVPCMSRVGTVPVPVPWLWGRALLGCV